MASSKGMIVLALLVGASTGFGIGVFCLRGGSPGQPLAPLAIPSESPSEEVKLLRQEVERLRERTAQLEKRLSEVTKQPAAAKQEPTFRSLPLSHWLLLLKDADPKCRDQGAEAIAAMGPRAQAAMPILIQLMMEDGVESAAVAKALVRVDSRHDFLRARLKDKDYRTRRNAAILLGILDTPAWPALLALNPEYKRLSDVPPFVTLHGSGTSTEEQKTWRLPEDREAIPVLIEVLADRQRFPLYVPSFRVAALGCLLGFGPEARAAVPALCPLLRDSDPQVREYTARTLGKIGPDAGAAVPLLLAALRDKEKSVAEAAAMGLGGIGSGDRSLVPQLVAGLKEGDPVIRSRFALALGETGVASRPALLALMEALKDKNVTIRAAAAEGLGGMKKATREVIDKLEEVIFDDRSDAVKEKAVAALGRFGPAAKSALPTLRKVANESRGNDSLRLTALQALGQIDPTEARPFGTTRGPILMQPPPGTPPTIITEEEKYEDDK
jgi:HEAT repeat protein